MKTMHRPLPKTPQQLLTPYLTAMVVILLTAWGWQLYQQQQYAASFSADELAQLRINYQVTEDIIAELKLVHQATNTRMRPITAAIAPRQPRHVWYKARAILQEVRLIKSHKNLPVAALPNFNTQHLAPEEVYRLLQHIMLDVQSLRTSYGITDTPAPSTFSGRALPNDVYANLNRISHMLQGIDRSSITPTDVYRLAQQVTTALQHLHQTQQGPAPRHITPASGKAPRDVYNNGYALFEGLQQLSQKPQYNITGGVILLKHDGGHIAPADVFNLLTNILADVEAIRFAAGDNTSPPLSPSITQEKIPSDVYNTLSEARALVEALL